jgi:hypothetical protein
MVNWQLVQWLTVMHQKPIENIMIHTHRISLYETQRQLEASQQMKNTTGGPGQTKVGVPNQQLAKQLYALVCSKNHSDWSPAIQGQYLISAQKLHAHCTEHQVAVGDALSIFKLIQQGTHNMNHGPEKIRQRMSSALVVITFVTVVALGCLLVMFLNR